MAGPIRGEPLGTEGLVERIREVAREQEVVPGARDRRAAPLLARLEESREILARAHERLTTAAANDVDVGPAGDWFLDNYHVVSEHVREVRDSLPRSYYRELPELVKGRLAGYPRVYELATTIISHTEGRIELETVDTVTAAFQEVSELSLGELWAVPAMLRLGLLENVRRMTLRTLQRLDEVELANQWAERILAGSGPTGESVGEALREFVAEHPPLTPIFVARLVMQLRLGAEPFAPLHWLEQYFSEEGLRPEEAAIRSADRLAITQMAMANSITSLRAVALMDWKGFVERQSVMESVLRQDPSGHYAQMTFDTRDRYRHVVERTSRRTNYSEKEVATLAIELARRGALERPDDARYSHVGYYLVDEGLAELERLTGYRRTLAEALHRWVLDHPTVVFVGGVTVATLIALAAVFWLGGEGARTAWPLVVLLALLPAADIAVNAVNQLVTVFLPPRRLPKLELRDMDAASDGISGIPPEFRTAVVVPTLLDSEAAVRDALEHLEVQFLANREANLHFALLSDFTDAPQEHMPGDEEVLAAARAGIEALNARYAGTAPELFHLLHRPRRWNPKQGVWMGWERKRGKLAEFNRFLRGQADGAFSLVVGDVELLRTVRYVITLDSDTVLPPDAAALLVGAMAHPLNRPVYDAAARRVVRGYGILQPRVGVSLPSAHRSRFAAIMSGHPGVDPYTTAVSDVYQDLFGEGSFTGKGIYDLDAFQMATRGRFPENTLLSHDLIEGTYARAGLASEIEVFDDYPSRYLSYSRRKHRWIRGDWQLLRWLTPTVPGPDGPEANRLSVLSRWKILDNLRRSVSEIAQLLFLLAGWVVFPGSPLRWTLLAVLAIAAPWIIALLLAAVRPSAGKSLLAYYTAVARDAVTSARQVALTVIFLPHQAWLSADAILRTLWRLGVSRRNLLEWQSASHTERTAGTSSSEAWRNMWPALLVPVAAFGLAVYRWATDGSMPGWPPDAPLWHLLAAGLPLLALWLTSPTTAALLSAAPTRVRRTLTAAQRREALRYALLHWRYFDRFVNEESNWLAPDNFQLDPSPVVAMRTSPTNIGLQLLSTVSAYDLGILDLADMLDRLEHAFHSMSKLPRFRGHFYNWYGLDDLRVLEPAYISTVDSGNLAGHLIALRQACLHIAESPVYDGRVREALLAGLALAEAEVAEVAPRSQADVVRLLRAARAAVPSPERDNDAIAALEAVAVPLREAHELLSTGAVPGVRPYWIDRCLTILAAYSQLLHGVLPRLTRTRDGREQLVYPTLRKLAETQTRAAMLVTRLENIASQCDRYVEEMDFRFLYDPERKLFSIGYQLAAHRLDPSYYDLLASEARLASFVAVALNDVPVEHWFRLNRSLSRASGDTALVSWSGSMFEYLMPLLVMRSFPFTLLDQTYSSAVRRQMDHGVRHGTPWGVSESAYNLRDRDLTYQYRAFGVPDLALKRGLGRDHVVSPYSSALAIMVDSHRSLDNLQRLESMGALGRYGFHDALDFTRPVPGERYAVVLNHMAHHVGMSLVALTNALTSEIWQRRFHDDPLVRSAELLLHERIPRRLDLQEPQVARPDEALPDPEMEQPAVRELFNPDTRQPHVALLGHLPYTIMVTSGGGGYSRFRDLDVTRWRSDGTLDNTGQFCYLRDVERGWTWSAAHQPVCAPADWFYVSLATDRVTFHRADGDIETRTEIAVVPADAAEVRRVTVTNNGSETRQIELTSYGEVVLNRPDTDRAHPAFANLFVETEWHEWCTAITATRRPRSSTEQPLWAVHIASAPSAGERRIGPVTCETDRARFIGRGRTTRNPVSLESSGPLSGTTGAVLDPIFAIRTCVSLEPGQSASVVFTTLVATSREEAYELADRYHDPHTAQRALDLAWTTAQVELRELGLSPADASLFQDIAGHLFFPDPSLRAPESELMENRGTQHLLWAAGISGDWPILLATIDSSDGLPTFRQLLIAHQYWRRRGMLVDLVVLDMEETSYRRELQEALSSALFASSESAVADRPGGVFLRRPTDFSEAELLMLRATARIHVHCDGRSLGRAMRIAGAGTAAPDATDTVEDLEPLPRAPGRATPTSQVAIRRTPPALLLHGTDDGKHPEVHSGNGRAAVGSSGAALETYGEPDSAGGPRELIAWNGYGGLTADGDYEIHVREGHVPPAPWINVIANAAGGFIVSERGAGFTWSGNSYFYRLTPWHNDPVSDPPGDVIYIQDNETGELWCPTPAPVATSGGYRVIHSAGSTAFHHTHGGIDTRLLLGVPAEDPVKLSILRLTNTGDRPRRLRLTAYAEWTLGVQRVHTQHQVQTMFDAELEAMLARNTFDPQFAGYVAFLAVSEPVQSFTADRREFLGRNRGVASPASLRSRGGHGELSGATGGSLDPCAALQFIVDLAPGETREIVVALGAAEGEAEARSLAERYSSVETAIAAVESNIRAWADRLGVISVRTPEPLFDAMINRWSLYQALACRMWARSALYQSSGAYGFRDQLQDVMAFVYAEPQVARDHILRAAARQFTDGDVQHWWHPQSGRGVRTRFSDDLAWLPYVVDHYVRVTGDASVLDEEVPFLSMRPLEPHEHEVYDLPAVTEETATVYEHCVRALRKACTTGVHGLPLIGIGDWNDGMSRVGIEGRGESVWLAWFLAANLRAFARHVEERGDASLAAEFRAQADAYILAVEENGWDGDWYRRAYFDDGTPLGSRQGMECRIDSIAQSWSVISGGGAPTRQARALASLEEHLVREDARLIMLLTPAFDRMPNDPGYIKGYLPGVRENGAQYTHAALWAVLAIAMHGNGDRAFELYQMINPLTHGRTPEEVDTYKVEPYVVAADVYTAEGQLGRGGWTWYTGSASWLYRVGLEAILGFRLERDTLVLSPRVPRDWSMFSIEYRYGGSTYSITVHEPAAAGAGNAQLSVDGVTFEGNSIRLVDDGRRHEVVVRPRRNTP